MITQTSNGVKLKNIVITLAAFVAALGVLFFVAAPKPQENKVPVGGLESMRITVNEKTFDFGEVSMARGNVSHVFTVKNEGADPVVVSKIYTSCMCTSASITTTDGIVGPFGMQGHGFIPSINRKINPGEEAKINVVFDPAAHGPAGIGRVERVIYIESGNAEPLEIKFTATVTP